MFARRGQARSPADWAILIGAISSGIAGIVAAIHAHGSAKPADVQSSSATQIAAIEAAEERLRLAIGLDREALKLRVDSLERRQATDGRRLELIADWACDANKGAPADGWPCGTVRWEGPARGRLTPERRTAAPYPTPP